MTMHFIDVLAVRPLSAGEHEELTALGMLDARVQAQRLFVQGGGAAYVALLEGPRRALVEFNRDVVVYDRGIERLAHRSNPGKL